MGSASRSPRSARFCVRLGSLNRAEAALNRALDVRSPLQFMRETTGAVFDTLAQIHLIRGQHEEADRCLSKARDAYGEYGSQTARWYQWSLLVLQARVALRRAQPGPAVALASDVAKSADAPPGYVLQAELIAVEALLASNLVEEAQRRLDAVSGRISPTAMSGTWGEFLRLRGRLNRTAGRSTEAYHDFGQSVSVFELLGERHQAGLSYLELGRLAVAAGARSRATRYLGDAIAIFEALGAAPDLAEARQAMAETPPAATGGYVGVQMDGEDALVRRIVDAAVMPALLAREGATALLEACDAQAAILFIQTTSGQVKVASSAGCDLDAGEGIGGERHARDYRRGDRDGADRAARPRPGRAAIRPGVERPGVSWERAPEISHHLRRPAPGIRSLRRPRPSNRGHWRSARAPARAAPAGICLRECRHAAGRGADPAHAGQ